MKEEKFQLHHLHRIRKFITMFSNKKFIKPTAYLTLLLLSYAFGYLSASIFNLSSSPSPILKTQTPISQTKPQIAVTGDDHFLFSTHCAAPITSKQVRKTILDRVFNGTSPYDGFPPTYITPLLRPNRVKGWGSKGAVFENLIRRVKPRTIIEIGSFLGASAIHMAELTHKLGLKTQILCVDDFRGWAGFRDKFMDIKMLNGDVMLLYQFMQNVVYFNMSETVLPIPFSTGSVLEKLCEWGVMGDLIEVDAGHDFHSAWADINRAYKILRTGGVMFGHDYFTAADDRGVRRAVNMFARVKGVRVQVDGQHWVIESV